MIIFETVDELQSWVRLQKQKGKSIGFAPTMGALHAGHLELIRLAKEAGDLAIASIFVNPTQFNDPKDLEKYPRMPEKDSTLLRSASCDALFMPSVKEVYPPSHDLSIQLDFGILDKVMEGKYRPGHFEGMATVVNRLLDIVKPDRLFMGQKDFQQLTIVRNMIQQLRLPIELVMCPTKREVDGLAMSSRNMRLTEHMRAIVPVIFKTLEEVKGRLKISSATLIKENAMEQLEHSGLKADYFEIVDGISLMPVENWQDSDYIVACTAAFAEDVRLIDNVIVKWEGK